MNGNQQPRTVRNFWVALEVDGRKTVVQTGPPKKDGGFRIRLFMRRRGVPIEAFSIVGMAGSDGEHLTLAVQRGGGFTDGDDFVTAGFYAQVTTKR